MLIACIFGGLCVFGEIAIKLLGAFLSVKLTGQIPAQSLSPAACISFLHRDNTRGVVLCLCK